MKTAATALIGAATLALAAPAAQAQPQNSAKIETSDLECLVFSFALADAKDDSTKSAGALAAFYFLGKIDGKSPGANLDDPILVMAKTLKPEDIEKFAGRCGAELQARGQSISSLGDRLQKAVAAEAAPAPAAPGK